MILPTTFADVSTHGWLVLGGILLSVAGLALLAAFLYAALRALHLAHASQEQTPSHCGLTGRQAAARFLARIGLTSDCIVEGAKIDHYDQLHRRLKLRTQSCVSSSVAALGIAAHEVGHAEQFAKGYWAARASHCLLALLVLGAAVSFIYPFAVTIDGAGDVNLTGLVALFALVAALRLPVTIALEQDASRRALRMLGETGLTQETEQAGIAHMLQAGLRAHVVLSVALVVAMGGGVATMWLVENGLGTGAVADVQVVSVSELATGEPLSGMHATSVDQGFAYPIAAVNLAVAAVLWAFSGRARMARANETGAGNLSANLSRRATSRR
jgi:Zn-dependent membrane protease YugP